MKTNLVAAAFAGALFLVLLLAGRPAPAQAPGSTGPTPQADPAVVPPEGGLYSRWRLGQG